MADLNEIRGRLLRTAGEAVAGHAGGDNWKVISVTQTEGNPLNGMKAIVEVDGRKYKFVVAVMTPVELKEDFDPEGWDCWTCGFHFDTEEIPHHCPNCGTNTKMVDMAESKTPGQRLRDILRKSLN